MSYLQRQDTSFKRTPSVTVGMVTLDVHIFDGHSTTLSERDRNPSRRIGIDVPEPFSLWVILVKGLDRGTLLTEYLRKLSKKNQKE